MKFRTMLGLAAAGGILYLHKRRGGKLTIDSLRDSARELWSGIQRSAERAKREGREELRETAAEVSAAAREVERAMSSEAEPNTGFGTGSTGGVGNGRS